MTEQFAQVPLRIITASLTNPRKTFDPVTLLELSESIKASGVHQPVLLRPLPGERVADTDRAVEYELVAGERRYRASQMAGLATIPALIRPLTDQQVLEVQIVENLQRDDLTELEEAEGYERLIQHTGMNVDAVADKIKKSRSYVFARLKLLDLSQECKQAMREGKIEASHAVLIARIPDTTLQTKALAEATRPIGIHGDQVISVRAFQSWLQANVMLRLDAATFPITDTRLVPAAGSCKDCPKRTGANPDLFAEVNSADLCTDPVCYRAKADAHRTVMVTKAEAKGMRLIEGKEATEICRKYSNTLDGYLPLSQVREDAIDVVSGATKKPTLRDLLGKDAPNPVLIEHPHTKELIEAVPEAEAEALLVLRGLIKATQEQAEREEVTSYEINRLKSSLDDKIARTARQATYEAVVDGIRATPDDRAASLVGGDMLRAWWIARIDDPIDADDMAEMFGYTFDEGVDEIDALTLHIRATSNANLMRALAVYMAGTDRIPGYAHHNSPLPAPDVLNGLCYTLQLSTEDITKDVKKTIKAETAAKIKALQAELKPTVAKPAAAPVVSETKPATNPAKRNRKINAEEAQAGIAEAMQATAPDTVPNCWAGDSFAVGQTVRITTDDNRLGLIARKHGGKTGTITRREDGGGYWDVTFKGRGGGVAMFAEDQMEALQA